MQFEKRCEVWQNEIRAGSVLAYVTKRIAAITPPRALLVLRFLLNTTDETDRIWPNPTTPCYLTNYCRSAETGERIGIAWRWALLTLLPAFIGAGIPAVGLHAAGDPPSLSQAWEFSRLYRFNEAAKAFEARLATATSETVLETKFGFAVNLLNRQPKTRANIDRSRLLLGEVAEAAPDSEFGIASRYFLGRIAHLHLHPPRIDEAIEHFRYLVEHHPRHFWGQAAASKYGFLLLYRQIPPVERVRTFRELELLAVNLPSPYLRSNFHFMLGTAAVRFDFLPERALFHFVEADRAGLIRGRARTDGLLRVGELARQLGERELAARYYRRYLAEFRRDPPRDLVRTRLQEVEAKSREAP